MQFKHFVTGCVITLFGCFATQAIGQTITTGAVSSNSLCPGDTVYVTFTSSGTFQPQNAFTAQLSNPNGGFDNGFARLGTTTDPAATYVMGVVPSDITPGSHYRIRVISTLPSVFGSDNGADISVGAVINVAYDLNFMSPNNNNFAALTGMPVTFYNASRGGSATYFWDLGAGASPATSPDSLPGVVTYSTPGIKTITLTATSSGGCVSSYQYSPLAVYDCFPAIPSGAHIDSSTYMSNLENDTVWVVSGATYTSNLNNTVIFVEPGSNVNLTRDQNIVYLKEGATCNVLRQSNSAVIIYVDSTGIIYGPDANNGRGIALLHCPTLNFDYTNAPPYHLTLGVNESATTPMNISLYPNPANDMLHVFTGITMPTAVRLFNTLGEEVWSAGMHVTNNVQIATDNLHNGVYYLQVTAPGKMSTEKVTVIH